jgi:hypothetical protein
MITDKDIERLKGAFATAQDHVNLEDKVDKITELVEKLPTRDDIQVILERTYNLATMKAEHERIKLILKEKLHVEI